MKIVRFKIDRDREAQYGVVDDGNVYNLTGDPLNSFEGGSFAGRLDDIILFCLLYTSPSPRD